MGTAQNGYWIAGCMHMAVLGGMVPVLTHQASHGTMQCRSMEVAAGKV